MALRTIQQTETDGFGAAGSPEALIASSSSLPPIIGTGCMACCSGGVDPTWGGVAAASSVVI
jgi:hypothetical protein